MHITGLLELDFMLKKLLWSGKYLYHCFIKCEIDMMKG